VHEQGQRISRRELRIGRARLERLDDLDVALGEFGAKIDKLVAVEIVLERERLERALFDRAALFGLVEKGANREFKNVAQLSSLPSVSGPSRKAPAPLESLDAAAALRRSRCPRVGGVAVRAHVDDELAPGRAGGEGASARGAADRRERELGMDCLQEIPPS
jgi:hypothetical protein